MSEATLETEEPTPVAEKAPAVMADSFRFDILVDTDKYNQGKLEKDVRQAMAEITGDIYWRASIERPDSMDIEDHPYANYEAGSIEPRILMVYKDQRPELTSSLALAVREACLAGISRAENHTVWTNGVGDMFVDTDPYDITYVEIPLHNSVVIDTGSEIKVSKGKKMTRLKFTISMPDNYAIIKWSKVREAINTQLSKVGWKVEVEDYNTSEKFGGNMYRWYITLMREDGTKPAINLDEITKVWEACLTGIHVYRLANPGAVILTHQGRGTMQLGDQTWEILPAPGTMFVGEA